MHGIPELTPEDIENMSDEDMADYKTQKDMEEREKQKIIDLIDSFDPYENFNGVNVIDTDYENYLIMYSCFQFDDEESGFKTPESSQTRDYIKKMSGIERFIEFQGLLRQKQ